MENKTYKLNFELVPDGCWYFNLRSILSKTQWDYIKKFIKQKAQNKCQICGKSTRLLDVHERWSYDDHSAVQKLENLVAVCKDCHSVIHIGRTQLLGNITRAEDHYIKVNNCTYSEFVKELGKANARHRELNKISEWKLDLTKLKDILD